jgi:hypothetical protein
MIEISHLSNGDQNIVCSRCGAKTWLEGGNKYVCFPLKITHRPVECPQKKDSAFNKADPYSILKQILRPK